MSLKKEKKKSQDMFFLNRERYPKIYVMSSNSGCLRTSHVVTATNRDELD